MKTIPGNETAVLTTTLLAENKTYMKWNNYWDQLILHGAVPFLALAIANFRYAVQASF